LNGPDTVRLSRDLRDGWELARSAAGVVRAPDDLADLGWSPALVPGTVAGSIDGLTEDPDDFDWWFRVRFDERPVEEDERLILCLEGIATVAEVYLNGAQVLTSRSMFASHRVDVSELVLDRNELAVCCRALSSDLMTRRKPRARWRTALADNRLRHVRTMLLGRAPGFAPGPAVVGLWRPVRLERLTGFVPEEIRVRPSIERDDGILALRITGPATRDGLVGPDSLDVSLTGPGGTTETTLEVRPVGDRLMAEGELRIPTVARWWPHTHGSPTLYELSIRAGDVELHRGRVGFRSLRWPSDWEDTGLALSINEVPIFARGAIWTPLDLKAPHQPEPVVRAALEQVVDAGMNMIRIAGIGCYESTAFYDLCDELGILVWQDFMLANLDYPAADPAWSAEFEAEARQELGRTAGRPSLTVLCGGSEVAQQIAMLGLDPEIARGELYVETLPRLIQEAEASAAYVPNSPWGGSRPFEPDHGVANYYGVGAYLRDLSDARLAEVKFAAECLAFSNVPDDPALEQMEARGGLVPHHPVWKRGVPRDAGAGWDFEDVRDHYLKVLYGEDPVALRWADMRRYLDLSRAVTGEVMAATFGEWRRGGSPCAGGLVLWLRDLQPGAGWGILDHQGAPKVAYHHLRRALAPASVWITGEGLRGVDVHLANDRPEAIQATLRVALYRNFRAAVQEASVCVSLAAHGYISFDVEELIGHFVDASYAYRFGPPGHDLVVASLESDAPAGGRLIASAFHFPVERPLRVEPAERLGLRAWLSGEEGADLQLHIVSETMLNGVRVHAPGFVPEDDAFMLEPGIERTVLLGRRDSPAAAAPVTISALNMIERYVASRESR
jgi:beta-mannosidase